jgi:hypothetical protein
MFSDICARMHNPPRRYFRASRIWPTGIMLLTFFKKQNKEAIVPPTLNAKLVVEYMVCSTQHPHKVKQPHIIK